MGETAYHRDGVPWWEATTPPERHTCWKQSEFPSQGVNRCACGAIQLSHHGDVWGQRNSRLYPQNIYGQVLATGKPYREPPVTTEPAVRTWPRQLVAMTIALALGYVPICLALALGWTSDQNQLIASCIGAVVSFASVIVGLRWAKRVAS